MTCEEQEALAVRVSHMSKWFTDQSYEATTLREVVEALRVPAQRAPTPDLTKALTGFSDFINEPPQYEDKRMVRDYRHELARKWVPLLEQLLALIID